MYMLHYVTITSQGQITIPAEIRRKFALDKVKRATVEVEGDRIVIEPEADILKLRGIFKTKKRIPFKKVRVAFGEYMARRHLSASI